MNPPHPGGSLTVRLRFSFNYRKDSRRSVTAGEGGGGGGGGGGGRRSSRRRPWRPLSSLRFSLMRAIDFALLPPPSVLPTPHPLFLYPTPPASFPTVHPTPPRSLRLRPFNPRGLFFPHYCEMGPNIIFHDNFIIFFHLFFYSSPL